MIKLVAFDMDGTFLNPDNDYNRQRFARIFEELQARDIKVVAISGNQYHQIKTFFADYLDSIVIASENGSKIDEQGKRLLSHHFDRQVVEDIIALLANKDLLERCVIAGQDHAYFAASAPADFKTLVKKYNGQWKEIDSLQHLPQDDFCVVTLDVPDQDIPSLVEELNGLNNGKAKAVSSGNNFIDILIPSVNKATALQFLGERWGIASSEMMAFGDSGNDLDMLKYVGYSYAMANAAPPVKEVATFQAPSNRDAGVLAVIEQEILEK